MVSYLHIAVYGTAEIRFYDTGTMFFLWSALTRNTKIDTTRKRNTMDFTQPGAETVGQPSAENTTFETIELGTDSPAPPALETSEARSFSLSGSATSTQSFQPPHDRSQPPPRYQLHLGNLGCPTAGPLPRRSA